MLENYLCRRLVRNVIVLRRDAKAAKQNCSNAFQSTAWALVCACIVLAPCIAQPCAMRTIRRGARCACRTLMFACCQTSFIAIRKPLYNLNYLKNCKNVFVNFYCTHFSSYLLRLRSSFSRWCWRDRRPQIRDFFANVMRIAAGVCACVSIVSGRCSRSDVSITCRRWKVDSI